jgi:outer membrane protein OmpA-like peptidoglycan-associated protein
MNVRIIHTKAPALALTVAAACAAALPAHSAEQAASKQENIGVTSGLVVGALAGGPFGAVFGAAAGAWLGDRYHKQAVENHALTRQLAQSDSERGKLDNSLMESRTRSDRLTQMLERRSDLVAQIMFRTNDATPPNDAIEQLKKLGALVSTMPEAHLSISGYADARGTEEFNSKLSKERADAVAAVLIATGIDASRLSVEAHGKAEATAAEGDLDGYAFDRRVVVQIGPNADEAVARRN